MQDCFFGIFFSKMAELLLLNITRLEVNYELYVSVESVILTIIVFAVIFLVQFLFSTVEIGKMNAINLLRSENVGEKKLKGNAFFAITGAIILGAAYYIAVSIKNPISAIGWFFVAVIMVIIASYLLFISGSVFLCNLLKKNKDYYYKPNHFVSVSSMAYRMKRNGAGLASICILATMVLVMISSSSCLYSGTEESIRERCPRELNFAVTTPEDSWEDNTVSDSLLAYMRTAIENKEVKNMYSYRAFETVGTRKENDVSVNENAENDFSSMVNILVISTEEYNKCTKKNVTLEDDEALVTVRRESYDYKTISIDGKRAYKVKGEATDLGEFVSSDMTAIPMIMIVKNNPTVDFKDYVDKTNIYGVSLVNNLWICAFDIEGSLKEKVDFGGNVVSKFTNEFEKYGVGYTCKEDMQKGFIEADGSLLFLGIVLSIVFIIATVLIIYFKQISEGYEDEGRFDIMQKVGMTKKEIKKSINSQLLLVFFVPLLMAGCHLAFAFPMIRKLLFLLGLNNVGLFFLTCALSFGAFAFFYVIVYKMTAKLYYSIVSGKTEK